MPHRSRWLGEPRQLENPHVRTEDVSIDTSRLGAMGTEAISIGRVDIGAGAGYITNAAVRSRRVRAEAFPTPPAGQRGDSGVQPVDEG